MPDIPDYPLFVYLYDADGFYEEPSTLENRAQLETAMYGSIAEHVKKKLEVRITDVADYLVFHAQHGRVVAFCFR